MRTQPSVLGLIVGFVVGMVLYLRLPWLLDMAGLVAMAVGGGLAFGQRRRLSHQREGWGWLAAWRERRRSRSPLDREVAARARAGGAERAPSSTEAGRPIP